MLKFSIFYPYRENARFDREHYIHFHMPKLQEFVGEDIVKKVSANFPVTIDPQNPPPFLAVGEAYLDIDDPSVFLEKFGQHSNFFSEDIPKYTDIKPFTQISIVTECKFD